MKKSRTQHQERLVSAVLILRKTGVSLLGLSIALFGILRELFVSMEIRNGEERRPHDSDLTGELNYRTGRLDAGTDPYGWYDD